MNLLEETLEVMKENGKGEIDVRWVGASTGSWAKETKHFLGNWEDFAKLADFEYDNGFGGQRISASLKIVGFNWWLERHEYDGSEWWEFKTLPKAPVSALPLSAAALRADTDWD